MACLTDGPPSAPHPLFALPLVVVDGRTSVGGNGAPAAASENKPSILIFNDCLREGGREEGRVGQVGISDGS